MFLPFPKATLLVPSGPDHDPDRKHLFIVLTSPQKEQPLVLMVGVSSIRPHQSHDTACLLYSGDHPFIRHESYVRYTGARLIEGQSLADGVKTGKLVAREPVSDEIMARIIGGLYSSRFISPKIRSFYEENH